MGREMEQAVMEADRKEQREKEEEEEDERKNEEVLLRVTEF